MRSVDGVPGERLGYEARLDSLHEGSDAAQMAFVEPFGAAEREADAMQRERIIATDGVEICERRSTAKVILGMHLEPGDARLFLQHGPVVLKAQPDPRVRGNRAARLTVHRVNHGQEARQDAW